MKIAVNTRFLQSGNLEGFGRFTDEIFKRLVKSHPEHEFYFLFDRSYSKDFLYGKNVIPKVIYPPARHPVLFYIWYEFAICRYLNKIKPDIFISPDGYLSTRYKGKQLAVIHDLNFVHYPRDLPASARRYLLKWFPVFAKKADRIITVSHFSKQDIEKQYGVASDNIDVVYNAADDHFRVLSKTDQARVRDQYTQGKKYFVYVGALHPRKNIHRLFCAFDKFKAESNSDIKLMVVGKKYWINESMQTAFSKLAFKDDIQFTGHLPQKDMCRIISSALGMTYVSYFEGFGIPVVEAMKSGVPVICSNVTALPEVVEDAALLINPFEEQSIVNAMHRISKDELLREELIGKGIKQAEKFNWESSAETFYKSILKTIG